MATLCWVSAKNTFVNSIFLAIQILSLSSYFAQARNRDYLFSKYPTWSAPDGVINLREGIIWRGSEWNLEAAASCALQCSETRQPAPLCVPSIHQSFHPLLSRCLAVGKRGRFCPFLSFSSSEDMSLNFNVGEYEYHGKAKRKCKSSQII